MVFEKRKKKGGGVKKKGNLHFSFSGSILCITYTSHGATLGHSQLKQQKKNKKKKEEKNFTVVSSGTLVLGNTVIS
jgi:hypothetical protein